MPIKKVQIWNSKMLHILVFFFSGNTAGRLVNFERNFFIRCLPWIGKFFNMKCGKELRVKDDAIEVFHSSLFFFLLRISLTFETFNSGNIIAWIKTSPRTDPVRPKWQKSLRWQKYPEISSPLENYAFIPSTFKIPTGFLSCKQ